MKYHTIDGDINEENTQALLDFINQLERTRHDRLSRGWMMNSTQYGADYHIIFRELIDRFSKLSGI